MQAIQEQLSHISSQKNVPLSEYTTFKVGGQCPLMFFPQSKKEMLQVLSTLEQNQEAYYILGKGSNLIVNDEGLDIVVICTEKMTAIQYDPATNQIVAEAGVLLSDLAQFAQEKSLAGLEPLSGIPGTVGGAVFMNAGAYGGEIKDVLSSSQIFVPRVGEQNLNTEEHEFGYRKSILAQKNAVHLSSKFELTLDNGEEIQDRINDFTQQRESKQPLEFPSAGSVFKRPEGYFAGKLIMDSGLMGCRIGGAEVSQKHAGFIVNVDNAKAQDILDLIDHVQKEVFAKFSVELEPEVKFLLKDGSLKKWK